MAFSPDAHPGKGTVSIPVPVTSAYCEPRVAQFVMKKVVRVFSDRQFKIQDPLGSLLFDVNRGEGFFTKRLLLSDASGKVLALLRKEKRNLHYRWRAYRGESESENELLFTMGKASAIQFTPKYETFLPANNSSKPDFIVQRVREIFDENYIILHNDTAIAEAKRVKKFIGKEEYAVRMNPGVDQAFIASILVIIRSKPKNNAGASASAGASTVGSSG